MNIRPRTFPDLCASLLHIVLLVPALGFAGETTRPGPEGLLRYERVSKSPTHVGGQSETGVLTVQRRLDRVITFDLVATSKPSDDDGFLLRNATIEAGKAEGVGRRGRYRFTSRDRDLGTCVITFNFSSKEVVDIDQRGQCWWFGVGVDVSGRYRQAVQESTVE